MRQNSLVFPNALRWLVLLCVIGSASCLAGNEGDSNWQQYRDRFITAEGRVLDTGNNHITHTEGQGWGMILAQAHNDRKTFDSIWQWTRRSLARRDVMLFSWRYDPADTPHVSDLNNATDGDLFIAWALHLAAQRWDDPNYATASRAIRRAIEEEVVRDFAGYRVLLPAMDGFMHKGHVDLNLSYWFMPALVDFAAVEPDGPWRRLVDDGQRLLDKARFGRHQLPPDWLRLTEKGDLSPSPNWPDRFGFEAVRIPLYQAWVSATGTDAMQAITTFWNTPKRQPPPAWVDLSSGKTAEYTISPGVTAINAFAGGKPEAMPAKLSMQDDYYSSTLLMLARVAASRDLAAEGDAKASGMLKR